MFNRALGALALSTLLVTSFDASAGTTKKDKKKVSRKQKKKMEKRLDKLNFAASYQGLIKDNKRYFDRLFKRFDEGKIKGLELIIASSSLKQIESGLGHTLLRFVDDVGTPDDDVVLSFVANVDTSKLNYIKGIFGGYPVFPQVKSLRLFMNDYVNVQKRDLDRYVVVSNEELRTKVINKLRRAWEGTLKHHLDQREKAYKKTLTDLRAYSDKKFGKGKYGLLPLKTKGGSVYALASMGKTSAAQGKAKLTAEQMFPIIFTPPKDSELGDYTFFKNNCAGALVKFFKDTGFSHHKKLKSGRIPLSLPKYLKRAFLTPYPVVKIHSLRGLKKKIVKTLKLKSDKKLIYDLSMDQVKKLEKSLNITELRKLSEVASFSSDAFFYYNELIKNTGEISFESLFGIKDLPESFYNTCSTPECSMSLRADINSFYGENSLEEIQKDNIKHSYKTITRRTRDHRTKRWETKVIKPYKGLLVNKELLDHQKLMGFLNKHWLKY